MKSAIIILFTIIFFQACSFKSPENQWEFNSSNAFNSYSKYFLIDDEELANSDLERAIKYAKQSANLEQLSRVYLGACALNISVEQDDKCEEYKKIEEFVSSKELKTYFLMLKNRLKSEQIEYLPKQYQSFSRYFLSKKYDLAFKSIMSMEQTTSQFIAASLMKKYLNKSQINYLVSKSSFSGYKKLVLFWLNYLYEIENNQEQKQLIDKKIKILKM
ncbi:MAG: hypothetical protein C0625_07525 [Arcobacter sp.]|nr:MAG: hypothetical protein C0625_07525 [Arcobacter sp.]